MPPKHSRQALRSLSVAFALSITAASALAQRPPTPPQAPDPVAPLVSRLSLEKYKATIKGLTQLATAARAPSAIATPSTGSKPS